MATLACFSLSVMSRALTDAVARVLQDKDLARELSCAGQKRVHREFRQEQIWEALSQEYLTLLQTRNLPSSKRLLDLVTSAAAIILLGPLIALVAVVVWTCMGRPILFRQTRPGYRANPFTLVQIQDPDQRERLRRQFAAGCGSADTAGKFSTPLESR